MLLPISVEGSSGNDAALVGTSQQIHNDPWFPCSVWPCSLTPEISRYSGYKRNRGFVVDKKRDGEGIGTMRVDLVTRGSREDWRGLWGK
jgi:hypothetical protein